MEIIARKEEEGKRITWETKTKIIWRKGEEKKRKIRTRITEEKASLGKKIKIKTIKRRFHK